MLSRQLIIPQTKSVKRVNRTRKTPEPASHEYTPIKKFELLYHPFDLKFRGKVNKWLGSIENLNDLLKSDFKYKERRLIKKYFLISDNMWPSQDKLSNVIGISKYQIRGMLVSCLLRIWNSQKGLA